MPWAGRYYYRSRRVNGKPRREYVGPGQIGRLGEQMDQFARELRATKPGRGASTRDAVQAIDRDLLALDRLADALARTALVVAGCHQHHRGEWRKRRDPKRT